MAFYLLTTSYMRERIGVGGGEEDSALPRTEKNRTEGSLGMYKYIIRQTFESVTNVHSKESIDRVKVIPNHLPFLEFTRIHHLPV